MDRLVTSRVRRKFRDTVNRLIRDLGRQIYVYKENLRADCPNCVYDTVNQQSAGIFTDFEGDITVFSGTSHQRTITAVSFNARCPICYGKGYLEAPRVIPIQALVTWNPRGEGGESGGRFVDFSAGREGENVVRIKTHCRYYEVLLGAEWVEIDGRRCEFLQPPFVRGLGGDALSIAFLSSVEEGMSIRG